MRSRPGEAGSLHILVGGRMVGVPGQGGATWAALQYVLGLRRLGHRVLFVEPVHALGASGLEETAAKSAVLDYFQRVVAEFGLESQAALWEPGSRTAFGLPTGQVRAFARSADLLVNISGALRDEALVGDIPRRLYLDLDPGFTQLWSETQGIDMGFDLHTDFATIGWGIGEAGSPVPSCGVTWVPTLQPVVLDEWPVARGISRDALTTVGNWRAYGSIEHEGTFYGQKAHSLRPLMDLPSRTDERFELAMSVHPDELADLEALHRNGWTILDPSVVAGTPAAYRRFIQGSRYEFGIAKSGYVAARCGWFSDRSVCYLASGRPVIAQDTGFGRVLPLGEGLFAFSDQDGALEAIETCRRDYARHARAARTVAEDYFDSDRVLARLLDTIEGQA